MEIQFHSVLTVATLFFFGLISPGPNFFVVSQSALTFGRRAGFATALGAAAGDAVYSSLGLFGVSGLVAARTTMIVVDLLGGVYLLWLGKRAFTRAASSAQPLISVPFAFMSMPWHFWRGFSTDLANPKTVIFFASIFAVTITPDTSKAARIAMLTAILATSAVWRSLLAMIFSASIIRALFERMRKVVERTFGVALCFFGVVLIKRAIS